MNTSIFDNRVLMAAFLAWAIAQVSKTLLELLKQRKLVLSRLVSSGGMPSSHSALVTGLAAGALSTAWIGVVTVCALSALSSLVAGMSFL